jgi:hypothetical protein
MATRSKHTLLSGYSYAWITLGLFVFSIAGHWIFGWFEYLNDQAAHQQPVQVSEYVVKMARGTLENWQSEFLQLLWQVGGLALFLYLGSPQSKEGDQRTEAKLDEILKRVDPEQGPKLIARLDREYPRA